MIRRARLVLTLALFALLGTATPVFAADLDSLRASGVIAERYDGFVEIRESGGAEARRIVEEVNAKRREIYRERAESQGVSVDQVGRVYAEQILERLPDGAWFRAPDGEYVQK
jgi:uncharacterized protein YdbL (DUF1318 family)